MKTRIATLTAMALALPALAGTPVTLTTPQVEEPAAAERLTGSLTVGYATNYTGRGYVVSHSVAQGDGVVLSALKLNYDFGKEDLWSWDTTIAYNMPCSGHSLYGLDNIHPIMFKNIENEFAVINALHYDSPSEKWNISFGHQFTHGGLLGVMAKHFRGRCASCVNEIFVHPEWTPYKWMAVGIDARYSISHINGFWFEPYVSFKAPIVGTPDDIKVAGVLTFSASATADYFNGADKACKNGSQAFWIKFATPWFVNENVVITPSVAFHWLGKGGIHANKNSHKHGAGTINPTYVPFRNFGVVGGIMCTYRF